MEISRPYQHEDEENKGFGSFYESRAIIETFFRVVLAENSYNQKTGNAEQHTAADQQAVESSINGMLKKKSKNHGKFHQSV